MEIESAPSHLRALPSWLLNQASLPAQRLVSEKLNTLGAHRSHYSLLASLDEFGPASQAALTRRSGIDRSDMVALINHLAAEELVRRAPDPEDRRRNVITITPAGRRHLRQLERLLAVAQDELLTPLTSPEREELVRLLTQIVEHHSRP